MIYGNMEKFHGLPVKDLKTISDNDNLANLAPRLRCEYDDPHSLSDYLDQLLSKPDAEKITALVLGVWSEDGESIDVTPAQTIEFLVANKARLPGLKALFVGDIISEENEISWIQNSDMSSLWGAFPELREFGVRGTNGLRLGKINHSKLEKLAIESGGLPAAVTREALDSNAPLTHFELWFGDENYGLTTELNDLAELFEGKFFPGLKTLALRNCNFADEIAASLANSQLLERIEHLDLSLGTFRDAGAEALIASGKIAHLKSLDVHHHYMSDEIRLRLAAATPNLIADKAEEPDDWDGELHYYVSVSE